MLLALPARGRAAGAEVRLHQAAPAEVARDLERAFGIPVEVRGGAGRQVTLTFQGLSPARVLDRVAPALGGSWRLKLRVRAGRPDSAPASPAVRHTMSMGLQDIPAARAFALVAKELGADLEAEGDLQARVAVLAAGVSADTLLDRIAQQAGATWSLAYVIQATDAPPIVPAPVAPPVAIRVEPSEPPRPASEIPGPSVRTPPAPIPSSAQLRTAVRAGLDQVLRASPDRRPEALRAFLQESERLFLGLARLAPAERQERLRQAQPLLTLWSQLYEGLAPPVQQQLAPISALLERHLRP